MLKGVVLLQHFVGVAQHFDVLLHALDLLRVLVGQAGLGLQAGYLQLKRMQPK